jgi:hypothetical protein
MNKIKRVIWLMKTYKISVFSAFYTAYVIDPKLAKEEK